MKAIVFRGTRRLTAATAFGSTVTMIEPADR